MDIKLECRIKCSEMQSRVKDGPKTFSSSVRNNGNTAGGAISRRPATTITVPAKKNSTPLVSKCLKVLVVESN